MVGQQALNAYKTTAKQAEIPPVKLIHMLYERVLVHLDLAEKGIAQGSPKVRGENLGKAIAIITELNTSINSEDESEAALFLRGLYTAILVELPKVAVSQDVKILQRAAKYMRQLKELWERTAMAENGFVVGASGAPASLNTEHEALGADSPKVAAGGLSVSI
ncbi:MAG: flagellar export chaperone FliS [Desulfobulbaceae bacterium]|nr:flagellar export chaperone FliS [Desulfobulbaceae bacterium]HIJ79498.1 flagellar export chaperone FliS [Deltaproteobacteria bacterium]